MGFIPSEVLRQILDRSDIVAVISSYIPLKNAGRNFKALCPFHHEKTPSFVVNPDKQIFHCFGCGLGGNVITFVMHQEHLEFPEAARSLAEKAGITIREEKGKDKEATQLRQQLYRVNEIAADYFHHNLLSDKGTIAKQARSYLQARQVGAETAKEFRLGLALDGWDGLMSHLKKKEVSLQLMEKAGLIIPRNNREGFYDRFRERIIFPICDVKAKCIAFGARALSNDKSAKYINSPETFIYTKGDHLYGLNLSKEGIARNDSCVVVEGYMDFITPFQAGVSNIVASLGTALTNEQIRLIRRYTKNVVMLFDTDSAGESAMIRSLDLLIEQGMNVKVVTLSREDDPDSFVRKYGVEKFRERLDSAKSLFEFKLSFLKAKHSEKTIEGRAKISAEMLATISRIPNVIVKSEYLKELAQTLSISEDALLMEMKRIASTPVSYPRVQEQAAVEVNVPIPLRPVERDLLKLMLEENEFIALTKQAVELSDFQNEYVRCIVEKIFHLSGQTQETSFAGLMSCFHDQRILQIISQLMTSEDKISGDKQRIHHDCIERLRQERMRLKRQNIRQEMESARDTGNHKRTEELLKEFNQLVKIKVGV